ncbi:MAG: glycosyltransferase family 4 protein [Egibacteraceae bacterium]
MRILFCVNAAPLPPMDGFRLVVDALVREFRQRHEVRVLAFAIPGQDPSSAPGHLRLVPYRPSGVLSRAGLLLRAAARGRPLRADVDAAGLRPALHEELARFQPDVVHVSSGRLAALGHDLDGYPRVLAALDAHHVNIQAKVRVASGLRRLLLSGEARNVRRFEATAYRLFDQVTTVTAADRDALLALDPSLKITVIPNGVDADHFAPIFEGEREEARLVFTGIMRYAPNITAAKFLTREILPRVRIRRPDARLALVGRDPAPAVRTLGELDGVTVTGEVPDLRGWITSSRVYVCPMRDGTGIKNKLLEAMACGVPCVATPLAVQGLSCEDGRDLLVAEGGDALADAVVRVLDDDDLARRLGEAARAYAVGQHSWSAVAHAYERLYRSVQTPSSAGAADLQDGWRPL